MPGRSAAGPRGGVSEVRRTKLFRYSSVLSALLAGSGAVAFGPAGQAVASGAGQGAAQGTGQGAGLALAASADTYASSGRKAAVFGDEDKLVVGVLDRDVKTSFLKFAVPAGAGAGAARLRLTTIGDGGGEVSVRRVLDNSWSEGTLSSGNAPALGPVLDSAEAGGTGQPLVLDLGNVVTGPGTYSFALTSGDEAMRFRSSESSRGGPELVLPGGDAGDGPAAGPAQPSGPAPSRPTAPAQAPASGKPAGGDTGGAGRDCVTGELLVPSCGVLWGAAAGGFTSAPRDRELIDWERRSGRTATIFHAYHKGDEPFPTKAEIAMTDDAAHPRVLLLNWKIAYGSTWARVARGDQDRRIDAFAERAKAYGKRFFLVLNHEPENDVIARRGSGMEARDFAAMYRHTILRLRERGVTNVVNVMAFMGNEKWMAESWWGDLYPGDDVVDWMGLDSYVSVAKGAYHYGRFGDLLDRAPTGGGPGFYEWATTRHPGKPMMVVEWGAYHPVGRPADKSAVFGSVVPELAHRPAIKAIVYFDTKHDDTGDRDISIDSTSSSLSAFRKLAADPIFDVKIG